MCTVERGEDGDTGPSTALAPFTLIEKRERGDPDPEGEGGDDVSPSARVSHDNMVAGASSVPPSVCGLAHQLTHA